MESNFKILLGAMIDESSLTSVQKQVAKERLTINADISIEDFAKSKAEFEKQISSLGKYIKTTLGDSVSDNQANQWARKYYDSMVSGAKQAVREQEKLNELQKKTQLDTQEKYYRKIIESTKQIYSLKNKLLSSDSKQTSEINRQIKALEQRNKYNSSQLDKKGLNDNSWERKLSDSQVALENQLKINQAKQMDVARTNELIQAENLAKQAATERLAIENSAKNIKTSIDNGAYSTQIDKLQSQFQKYGLSVDEAEAKVKELKTTLSSMESTSGDKLVSEFNTWENQLKGVKVQLDQAKLSYDKFAQPAKDSDITNTLLKVQDLLSKNSKATKEVRAEWKRYISELSTGSTVSYGRLAEINQQLKQSETQMRTLGRLGKSLKDQLQQAGTSFTQWVSVSSVIMAGIYNFKNALTELKEVNTIITEISKANDKLTKSELLNLGNIAFDQGSKYGKGASSYLSGIQEASRAGYINADEIAETSVLAQSAGDMTSDLANKYLIATDAAYKFNGEITKLNEVLDGQNYITNHNAVSMSDLAEATKVTASQAASSGVEVEKMTAAISTMIATTQEGGDIAGRAFKAILMNVQQVKGETDDGEIIDDASLKKVEKSLKNVGVELKEVQNGVVLLRDPMEVLKELSAAYRSMDKMDARRANIISDLGGKYRGNQLNALLENWDKYEKMLSEYSQGSGSAFEEAMKSANNWEGSLNKLSNTWTDTIGNIVNSDDAITTINALNDALSLLNKTTEQLGLLGTVSVLGTAIASTKGLGLTQVTYHSLQVPFYKITYNAV